VVSHAFLFAVVVGLLLAHSVFGAVFSNMVLSESRPPATLVKCTHMTNREKCVANRGQPGVPVFFLFFFFFPFVGFLLFRCC